MSNVPPMPPRRYPEAKEADLVRDVTIVVSAKDFLSPAFQTLQDLNGKVPNSIPILFTYPKPVIEPTESFVAALKAHQGNLTNVEYIELPAFANPFLGWVLAAHRVQTKYIFFMHNDVFLLDKQCLSELVSALEENLGYGVAAPHIYESDGEGRLVAHAISTNLHLRRKKNSDVQFLSHEVNPLSAVLRHPNDFHQKEQLDFLEDHGLLMRTYLAPTIIDPQAAFTMEYMDMQLMVRHSNTTVLYVPTARIEFRPWGQNVQWRDLLFFVYRRSERLARGTKQYLEEKWGVEFPNTGFCNFVKFSVLRHFMLRRAEGQIPDGWAEQAALVASWYEFVGFNQFVLNSGEVVDLPHIVNDAGSVTALHRTVTALRVLVPTRAVQPDAARIPLATSGLLPLLKRAKNLETRAKFEMLSFGVIRKELASEEELQPFLPYCGLVVRHASGAYTCHMYLSPFDYDNLVTAALEWLHWRVRLAPRVAVYYAMAGNRDLGRRRWAIYAVAAASNATALVCGEKDAACEFEFEMGPTDELLQVSARVNSWGTVRLALIGADQWWHEAKGVFVFVMSITALLYSDAMSRRCMQGTTVVIGCFWLFRFWTLERIMLAMIAGYVAHLPLAKPRASHRRWTMALSIGWVVGHRFLTTYQRTGLALALLAALALQRAYKLLLTLMATAPPSIVFKTVSNLFPAVTYDRRAFFRADGASEETAVVRERAFDALALSWTTKFPKSYHFADELAKGFSDLRFANGNRVFPPFNQILNEGFKPVTVVTSADRMYLEDVDGNRLLDISGSYGVNVCGYDEYKRFLREAQEQVGNLGCVLGPVHPLVLDNINRLRKISSKEEVSFHMSGTEAMMGAIRLARFNTKKNLVVLFGGAYHGWWDGVQTVAGSEREVPDCLTLKDLNPLSLKVISARRSEIAAVVVNPLQSFHPNSPPPSDLVLLSNSRQAKESNTYKPWLIKLRALCDECGVALIFDEVYTGFRLARGGAQEYFGVQADFVVYGKTVGGGLPVGVVCSSSRLMNRTDPDLPMRVAYVIGTFAAHPWVMATMNAFLKWLDSDAATVAYTELFDHIARWCIAANAALEKEAIPLRVTSYASVWTMLFQKPGRYHWMLQYYLRDEGINLSWVGTGRLNFSLDFTPKEFDETLAALLRSCRRMAADGWWADQRASSLQIQGQFLRQVAERKVRCVLGL
eukprot:TRINITY_DN920_c0_g1_i1.p1 TRINITY_DN920_c0_g1~~TRINITY_DN920_c0_g1_i1.p1  ORF type:complete len:1190 (-),score=512.84 TRINITY_DN920_c0_g1_i1:360-3929(-)